MARVAVLASGRGSNLQALIAAQAAGALGPARIELVVANVPGAQALARAAQAGIPAELRASRGRAREEYDRELLELLHGHDIQILCLAGYLRLLSADFFNGFQGPILNVHPSLLPAFPGLDAQRQALEHGVKVSGATVHLVDLGLDNGPILLQGAVPVLRGDTRDDLAERILTVEHQLYPRALRLVAQGRYRIEGRRVHVAEEA